MSRTGRNSLLLLVVALLLAGSSLSATAASEGEGEGGEEPAGEVTTTTIADTGLEPAVEMGGEEPEPTPVDWTYRYMVPTALVLAVIVILVTAIKYFTDVVRKRYRILDE